MRLLLDTHTFLWLNAGDAALSARARRAIEDGRNDRFLSVASVWEIAIKVSQKKLDGVFEKADDRVRVHEAPRPEKADVEDVAPRINEFQDLAEQLAAVKKAAIGYDLKLTVRIEIGGKPLVGDEVVASVNEVLAKVKDSFKLQ